MLKKIFKPLKSLILEIKPKEMGNSFVLFMLSAGIFEPLLKPWRNELKTHHLTILDFLMYHAIELIVYISFQALVVSKRKKDNEMRKMGLSGLFYSLMFSFFTSMSGSAQESWQVIAVTIVSALFSIPFGYLLTEIAEEFIHKIKRKDSKKRTEDNRKNNSIQPVQSVIEEEIKPNEIPVFHYWLIDDMLINFKQLVNEVKSNKDLSDEFQYEIRKMYNQLWKLNDSYQKLSEETQEIARKDILDIIDLYMEQLEQMKYKEEEYHLNEIKKIKRVTEEKY